MTRKLVPRDDRITINHEFSSVDEFIAEYVSNISRSGVLFRTNSLPAVGSAIELEISLLTGSARQTANCHGHVVRTRELADGGEGFTAATIIEHRLVRTAGDQQVDILRTANETPH